MRFRSSVPAEQLGSAAGRYQDQLRPPQERGFPWKRRSLLCQSRATTSHFAKQPGEATGGGPGGPNRGFELPSSHELVEQTRDDRMARLESVLFVAKVPLHARKLGQYANLADGTEALTLIHRLNQTYDQAGRAFRVVEVAGGWQLRTRRQFASWVRRLPHVPKQVRLSAPAMETLAVIAYRQPVIRAEVESVRGVACGEIIRQLMDRDLVRVAGRSEELGRPFIYSTTRRFLEVFGLRDLDELPRAEWIKRQTDGLATAALVEGANERGESAVTLTTTQHERSTDENTIEQLLTEKSPGDTVNSPGDAGVDNDAASPTSTREKVVEEIAEDDDEYEDEGWDEEEDGDWEDDEDDGEEQDDEYEYKEVDDDDDDDDEWEEVDDDDDEWEEVEVDDDDDEWEDVEEGDDLDDDDYEYEEIEVDNDDDELEDDDEEELDDDDDEYEYEDEDDESWDEDDDF